MLITDVTQILIETHLKRLRAHFRHPGRIYFAVNQIDPSRMTEMGSSKSIYPLFFVRSANQSSLNIFFKNRIEASAV